MTAQQIKKGFTLIELLIVMAILGVLAVVVLVAINPAEQLARTRDAGRASTITQMGHAVQAFYTSHGATYPVAGTWTNATTNDLVQSGELSNIPAGIAYSLAGTAACATNAAGTPGTWCYQTGAANTIVYASLESKNYDSRCNAPATERAFFLFSVNEGKGGVFCVGGAGDPTLAATYAFRP